MKTLQELCSEVARLYSYASDPEGRDVWKSPGMLRDVEGLGTDCEDATLLLLEMVREEIPELGRFFVIGDSPGGRHVWCYFAGDDGKAWWADPTFGGDGRVSAELWGGYVPMWAYRHDAEGKLGERFEWKKADA